MKVRMLMAAGNAVENYPAKAVVDLEDALAENWIAAGIAEALEPAPSIVVTGALDPVAIASLAAADPGEVTEAPAEAPAGEPEAPAEAPAEGEGEKAPEKAEKPAAKGRSK